MTINVSDRDDGGQVRAQVGDTIELQLTENATTGYKWDLDNLDAQQFELAAASGQYAPGPPGTGGTAQFQIKVRSAGTGTLKLKYWRSWQGEAGVAKRFSVRVDAS